MDKDVVYQNVVCKPVRGRQSAQTVQNQSIKCPVDKQTAARILGASVDTLDQWTARYGIPHIKYDMAANRGNRGKMLYLVSDLIEFRNRYRVEGTDVRRKVEEIMAETGQKA
jgi:hypothetical protein